MSASVNVVIGPGSIGQAIARRVSVGRHVLLADLREENAAAADIELTADDLDEIENIVHNHPNVGNRYSEGSMRLVNQ